MKVQEIETFYGNRYILLDDNYEVIDEVYRFVKYLDSTNKSPNTIKAYCDDLKNYYSYMKDINIDVKDLCSSKTKGPIDILSGFLNWLKKKQIGKKDKYLKNRTINREISSVLSFYNFLASNNEIEELDLYRSQRINKRFKSFLYELVGNRDESNVTNIFFLKTPNEPVEPISREEFNIMYQNCRTRRDKLLISLLYETGMRINEALGIHLCDLSEIEKNILHIVARENNENCARVKNHAEGIVYLPDYVVNLLIDYVTYDLSKYGDEFLFVNAYGQNTGEPMRYITVEKLFERLSKKIGFKARPHMLRHGFATEKLEFGWTLVDIKSYLRHESITSTEIYADYSNEKKMEYMNKFLTERAEIFASYEDKRFN